MRFVGVVAVWADTIYNAGIGSCLKISLSDKKDIFGKQLFCFKKELITHLSSFFMKVVNLRKRILLHQIPKIKNRSDRSDF